MPESEAAESDNRRAIFVILGCIALILVGYGLFVAFVPAMRCPDCHGRPVGVRLVDGTIQKLEDVQEVEGMVVGKDRYFKTYRYPKSDVAELLPCERCHRRGRVPILRWILWEPAGP